MLGQRVDQFRVASMVAIGGAEHRHGGEKWEAPHIRAIEPAREKHRLAGDLDKLVGWDDDARPRGELERDRFPGLDAVVIGLSRGLGDIEPSVAIDDRGFRASAAQGRARGEDHLEIFVRLFAAQEALGDLQ